MALRLPDGQTGLKDLVPTLHASYRQVDFWIRCGYVAPRLQGLGSGTHRGVTASEAAEIRFFDYLVAFGIAPARVVAIRDALGDSSAAEFTEAGITITVFRRPSEQIPA